MSYPPLGIVVVVGICATVMLLIFWVIDLWDMFNDNERKRR